MTNLHIREASEKDRPILLNFEQNLIEYERPFDPYLKTKEVVYYDMDYLLNDPQVYFVVATDGTQNNDIPIACGYAKLLPNPTGKYPNSYYSYIGFMYTEPAYRRQGIAQQILSQLVAWSKQQQVSQIVLDVYSQNHNAIKAYQKAGFEGFTTLMIYNK